MFGHVPCNSPNNLLCAADPGQHHWSDLHHWWLMLHVSMCLKMIDTTTGCALLYERPSRCAAAHPALAKAAPTACYVAGQQTLQLSAAFRFVGAKDMGSNFYPFTAARKGNKLVTKGLFSKLVCMLNHSACPCLREPPPPSCKTVRSTWRGSMHLPFPSDALVHQQTSCMHAVIPEVMTLLMPNF